MQDKIDEILEGVLPERIDERVKDNVNAAFGAQLSALSGFSDPAWSMVFIEKLSWVSDEDSLREFEEFLGRAIFVAETEGELLDEDGCYMYLELAKMLAGSYGPGQFDKYFPGLRDMENREQAVSAYIGLRLLGINQAIVEAHGSLDGEKARIESTYVLEDNGWLARKQERDTIVRESGELEQALGGGVEELQPLMARLEANRKKGEAAKQKKIDARKELARQLYQAIKDGNDVEAERLIEAGADFSVVVDEQFQMDDFTYENETALTLAIGLGKTRLALKMIGLCNARDKAKLEVKNAFGNTALLLSAGQGHLEIVEALIKARADLNVQDKEGYTALIWAAINGHTAIAEALIKALADLNKKSKYGNAALLWAAGQGHLEIVEALIKARTDLNVKNEEGWTALIWAAEKGHLEIVEALIKAGAGLNVKNEEGCTALIWAAINGHTATAEALIKAGADLNVKSEYGNTALLLAAINGRTAIVEALIKAKANLNVKGEEGCTALIWAAEKGHLEIVEALIKAGADLNVKNEKGWTALIWAAVNGHTAIAEALIKARADLNVKDENEDTALIFAALNGHTAIAEALIKARANLNVKSEYGNTALLLAALNGHTAIVEALIKARADLNVKGNDKQNALIWAAVKRHTAIAEALIKAGADLNVKDKNEDTALIKAAGKNHSEIVEALIKARADLNVQGDNGWTALIWAAFKGHSEIAEALIKAGADLNVKSEYGNTALIWAAINGRTAIAEALIKAGADLNVKNEKGYTALILAALNGHTSTAEALIKAGADLNVKDNDNKTALIYAIQRGKIDIAIALLNAGADPFIDPASYLAIPQLEQFRDNYIGTIINAHGTEALPILTCSANNSEASVMLFFKYAVANGRADLICQAMARYKEMPANIKNALRDEEIAKAVIQCVAQDTVNDNNNNLFVLKSIAHANDIETYTLEDIFELRYGNLFWNTFKDILIKAIKTTKEKSAIIAKLNKELNKDSLAKLVKQVKELKEDKEFRSRFGLGKQELLNELLKKSVELSDLKSFVLLLSQGAEPKLTLGSDQSLLEATWNRYNSMQVVFEMVREKHPDFEPARSIFHTMLIAKETNINIRSIGGQTILHAVASQGNASDIALLILRGANPDALNNMGKKPGFYAKKDLGKLKVLGMTAEQILADKQIMKQILKDFSVKELTYIIKASGIRPSELIRHEESLVTVKKAIDDEVAHPTAPEAPMSLDPAEQAAPASDGYSQDLARLMNKIGYDSAKAPKAYATTHSGGGEKFGYKLSETNKRSVELHSIRRHIDENTQDSGSSTGQTTEAIEKLNKLHQQYSIPIIGSVM